MKAATERFAALSPAFLAKIKHREQSGGHVKRSQIVDFMKGKPGREKIWLWWPRLIGGEAVPLPLTEAYVDFFIERITNFDWSGFRLP